MIKHVLVPLDGSEPAYKALDFALDLAEKYSADLVVLSVVHVPTVAYVGSVEPVFPTISLKNYTEELKASHEKMLSEAIKKAKKTKPDLKISAKLVEGQPSHEIIKTAKEGSFDIIVIGSRGLGGIKEFFLGSVSNRVSHDAECPVLIVK